MKPTQTATAKISRPRPSGFVPRPRLFRALDQGRQSPITWVSGPAGAGKTTLASSWLSERGLPCIWYQVDDGDADIASFFYYMGLAAKQAASRYKRPLPVLTPEYALGIPAFTRRFFEQLCGRLKSRSVIIFDNYHEAPESSAFHEMMANGLSVLPEGVRAIVLSRAEPPHAFAGMWAGGKIHAINGRELKLTTAESKGLVGLQGLGRMKRELSDWMHEKTQGWAAGVVLLARTIKTEAVAPMALNGLFPENVFAYFANELFDRADGSVRDFLLVSSLLPTMTVENAGTLTGNDRAGHILSRLSRNNFFTEKHGASPNFYRYHPLFREFLQARLKESHDQEAVARLQKKAAQLLDVPGQTEDAATLFIESGDRQSLVRLILEHAPEFLAQGRSGPIEAWLARVPRELVEGMPWLLYWKGICRLAFNPRESQNHFEKAFGAFESGNDAVGVFLAWTGIIESIEFAFENMKLLDAWVGRLPALVRRYGGFPSKQIESRVASAMLPALVMRQPAHRDFEIWRERALAEEDVNFRINSLFHLAFHYSYRGYVAQALATTEACRKLAKSGAAPPAGMIRVLLIEQVSLSLTGRYAHSRSVTQEGLQLADKTGIHIFDVMFLGNGAINALNNGDREFARLCIRRLNALYEHLSPWDRSLYHLVMATEAFVPGDLQQARAHMETAIGIADPVGVVASSIWNRYQSAVILNAAGESEKADAFLEEGRSIGRTIDSMLSRYEYCLIKAQFSMERGDEEESLASVREAMEIGKRQGIYGTYYIWQPPVMARIAVLALENHIEVEYVQELVRRRNLVPEEPPVHIENWPWPVRIFTLGEFRLQVDGKPVSFSGKVRKPLEMLKALIAMGGSSVREDRLSDALWPEAEGDAAGSSYRTTLHRLRHLIGNENAVMVRESRVSLDPRYCWVDAWAFEKMLENTGVGMEDAERGGEKDKSTKGNRQAESVQRLEQALRLYRGHFLAAEDRLWATSPRERFKNVFLRAVERLGSCRLDAGQAKKAMECYEKGLEVDDLSEEFYQGLMACNLKLGSKSGALAVYNRCKKVLLAGLGMDPSDKTEDLYKRIKGD